MNVESKIKLKECFDVIKRITKIRRNFHLNRQNLIAAFQNYKSSCKIRELLFNALNSNVGQY